MVQVIQFEGTTHQFPDDFTSADIQRALSSVPRVQTLPEVPAADRRFPLPMEACSPSRGRHPPRLFRRCRRATPSINLAAFRRCLLVTNWIQRPIAAAPAPPTSQPNNSLTLAGTTPAQNGAPARVVVDTSGRPSAMHSFAVGAQGVGKGLTDIVTGPFDLVAGAQNLATAGINKVFGTNIPMATPASSVP